MVSGVTLGSDFSEQERAVFNSKRKRTVFVQTYTFNLANDYYVELLASWCVITKSQLLQEQSTTLSS